MSMTLYLPRAQPNIAVTRWASKYEDSEPELPTTRASAYHFPKSVELPSPDIAFEAPQRRSASVISDIDEVYWQRVCTNTKHKSASVISDIEELIKWLTTRKVRVENADRIQEYLLQFTELLDVIPQAVNAAKEHFQEAQLVMDVYQDPEIPDCYLVLNVRLTHYDDSLVERLEKAEAKFLDQLVNKKGWIQLTTDFRGLEEK